MEELVVRVSRMLGRNVKYERMADTVEGLADRVDELEYELEKLQDRYERREVFFHNVVTRQERNLQNYRDYVFK
jgi:molecular chaperone GrpE (heat shock protein)